MRVLLGYYRMKKHQIILFIKRNVFFLSNFDRNILVKHNRNYMIFFIYNFSYFI